MVFSGDTNTSVPGIYKQIILNVQLTPVILAVDQTPIDRFQISLSLSNVEADQVDQLLANVRSEIMDRVNKLST